MPKPFWSVFSHVLDVIIPPACLLCGAYDREPVCSGCWTRAKPIVGPYCKKCGLPIGLQDREEIQSPYLCYECRQRVWHFDRAREAFVFEGPVRKSVHMMKYNGRFGLAAWLGQKMMMVLQDRIKNIDREKTVMVPVPLSSDRLREREFNHAFYLAKPISRITGIPLCPSILIRKRGSKPQVGLRPKERWANVRGTFHINRPERVKGKHVILVDDVLTTGATVNECARTLKKAGVIHVEVWALARTLSLH